MPLFKTFVPKKVDPAKIVNFRQPFQRIPPPPFPPVEPPIEEDAEITGGVITGPGTPTPTPPPMPQAPRPEFVRKGDFVAQYYEDKGWKQLHRGTATTEEIRADISKLAEASEAYGKIYGVGEEFRSAGLKAVGFVPVAGTIVDWERMTPLERGISIAVDTAILAIPAFRGAKAGANKALNTALNQGLDKWIASQSRILPEAQSGLYRKITSILGEKSVWLTEKATQNLIKNKNNITKAAEATVKDIEKLLLEAHPVVKGQTRPLADIMKDLEGTALRAKVPAVAELKPKPVTPGIIPTPKGVVPPPPIALPPASEESLFDDALRIIREKVIPAQKVARGKTAKIFTEERGKAFGEVEKVFKTPAGEATVGEAAKKLGIGEMERAAFEPVEGLLSQAHKDAVINELATNVNIQAAEKFNAMLSLKRLFSPLKYVVEHPKTASTVPPNTPLRDFELKILEKAWGKSTADDLAKAIEMLAADPIPVDIAMKNYLLGLKNIPFGKPKIGEKFIPTEPVKVPVEAYRGQRLQELMIDLADSPTPINPTIQEAVKRTEQFFLMPPTKREKFLKILDRVGYNAIDVLGIPKTIKFSFDLSYPLRQGLLLGLKSPKKWVTQWKPMIKALRSDEVASKFHRELLSDTETATAINRMGVDLYGVERGMKWMERPEELASTIAEHIPGIRASARAAATFMNGLMVESAVKQYRILTALGESEGSFRAMGALINQLAGRGTLPKWLRGTAGDVTNKILTSPRFAVSRFQWPTKIFSESPTVRKEAAKSLIAYISWGTSLIGLAVLGGARIEGDPRSSQALKIRIGNTRIDIWAGGVQIIRMLAQLAPYVDPKTGEIDWTQGSRKTAAGEVIPMSRWDVMARFGESKVQPGIGALKILLTGKTYIGEEVDLATPEGWAILVKEGLAPLALEELVVAYIEEGMGGAVLALGEFGGLGVQTYADKPPVPSGRPTQKDASQKARDRMNRLQKVPTGGGDAARKRAKALGLR